MGGLLPAPGSLSSALRSRYRSNWPQWRRAPASHPARPARTRRDSPPGPPVKRRAFPLAFPQLATAPRRKSIGGDTCLSSISRAHWLLGPRLPDQLFSPADPESPPPPLIGRPGRRSRPQRARSGKCARPCGGGCCPVSPLTPLPLAGKTQGRASLRAAPVLALPGRPLPSVIGRKGPGALITSGK